MCVRKIYWLKVNFLIPAVGVIKGLFLPKEVDLCREHGFTSHDWDKSRLSCYFPPSLDSEIREGERFWSQESQFVNVLSREQLLLLTAQREWPMSHKPMGPGGSRFISSSQSEGVVRKRRKDSNSTERFSKCNRKSWWNRNSLLHSEKPLGSIFYGVMECGHQLLSKLTRHSGVPWPRHK